MIGDVLSAYNCNIRSYWLSVLSCGNNSVYARNANRFSTALPICRLIGRLQLLWLEWFIDGSWSFVKGMHVS